MVLQEYDVWLSFACIYYVYQYGVEVHKAAGNYFTPEICMSHGVSTGWNFSRFYFDTKLSQLFGSGL